MNDHPVHRDDITALRREDDLKAYMRSLIKPTKTPAKCRPRTRQPRWGAIPIPPDHKPGAWPPGTSPPGPAPERSLPLEVWADAIRRYRTETRHQLAEEDQCTTSATTSAPSSTTASPTGASPAPNDSPPHPN